MKGRVAGLALSVLYCGLVLADAFDKSTYYSAAEGKKGEALKTALAGIIYSHTERTYANLWTDMQSTDCRSDGKVWDMYSSATNFTWVTDQAGNYSAEGDVYNREHSFPKSWFDDGYPMYTDLYHLYPTDGFVNNKRSNHCFGEVGSITYSSSDDFSKLGTPTSELTNDGCSEDLVFEPNDLYKGDFARTYFYMVTAYESVISSWSGSGMIDNSTYPAFTTWAKNMLMRWAEDDVVSEKETNRIEAVYDIQGNRNPFIDFPGLEEYIWGDFTDVSFSIDNYVNPYEDNSVTRLKFASSTLALLVGDTLTNAATTNSTAAITYASSDESVATVSAEGLVTARGSGSCTITASIEAEGDYTAATATCSLTVQTYTESLGSDYAYRRTNTMVSGKKYLIGTKIDGVVYVATPLASSKTYGYLPIESRTETDGVITLTSEDDAFAFEASGSGYTIMGSDSRYLYQTGSYNSFNVSSDASSSSEYVWTIAFDADSLATITNSSVDKIVQYAPSYTSYGSYSTVKYTLPYLYVQFNKYDLDDSGDYTLRDLVLLLEKLKNGSSYYTISDANVLAHVLAEMQGE